jgi:acid phosphatase family membrane protein YuiD
MVSDLLANFPLWTSLMAILLAQFLKIIWNLSMTGKWDWIWIYHSGGMPSGHTSAVSSLSIAIGLTKGWDSPTFAIATILSIVVMYDATGVRRQAGVHAQVLNRLVEDMTKLLSEAKEKSPAETREKLKEILGHKPIEVFVGLWFGVIVAIINYYLWY